MKKILIVFLLLFFSLVASVAAQTTINERIEENKIFRLAAEEVLNEDLFAAGERVEILGTVNGDVYAAGQEIYISGNIAGDLLAAGGNINFTGVVGQDLRLAGGNMTIAGRVGKNASLAGGIINLRESGNITGGLSALYGNLDLASPVGRYFKGAGGNLTISNSVGGDVSSAVGALRITDNGRILGDLTYWSKERANIDPQAQITGQTVFNKHNVNVPESENLKRKTYGAFKIGSLLTTVFFGLIYLYLFPRHLVKSMAGIREQPLLSFIIGIISPIIVFILCVIFFMTIIGIPLSFFLLFLYFFILYFARLPFIFYIGNFISGRFNSKENHIWSLVFGFIIYWILSFIPIIGGFTKLLATTVGFGSLVLAFNNKEAKSAKVFKSKKKK